MIVVRRLRRVARTPIVVIIIVVIIVFVIIIKTALRRRRSSVEIIGQLGIGVTGLVGARICRQPLLDIQTDTINGARLGCYQLVQFDCESVGRRQIVLLRIEQYEFMRHQTADTLKLTRAANAVHLQKLANVAFFYLNHLDQNSPVIARRERNYQIVGERNKRARAQQRQLRFVTAKVNGKRPVLLCLLGLAVWQAFHHKHINLAFGFAVDENAEGVAVGLILLARLSVDFYERSRCFRLAQSAVERHLNAACGLCHIIHLPDIEIGEGRNGGFHHPFIARFVSLIEVAEIVIGFSALYAADSGLMTFTIGAVGPFNLLKRLGKSSAVLNILVRLAVDSYD